MSSSTIDAEANRTGGNPLPPESSAAERARRPHAPLALFAASAAFLLPVAYSPAVAPATGPPKEVVLLLLAAVGLPVLMMQATVQGSWPARAAVAFIGVAAASALASDYPAIAMFGRVDNPFGWLFLSSLCGSFAVGAALDERGRRLVTTAIVAAMALNVTLGVVELFVDLETIKLGVAGGRSSGFLGNPVHLAALCAASVPLAGSWMHLRLAASAATVAVAAVGIQVAGGRIALVVGLIGLVWALRHARQFARAALVAAFVAGVVLGAILADIGGGLSSTARISEENGATLNAARIHNWRTSVPAIMERPLFGHGPGRYQAATGPHRTRALAEAQESSDSLFDDAHNLFVEYATTIGVLGLLAFLAWIVVLARSAQDTPLLWFAVALFLSHMLQPSSLGTTALMFLGAGAALPTLPTLHAAPLRVAVASTSAGAVVASALLLYASYWTYEARLSFEVADAKRADAILGWAPETANLRAVTHTYYARVERSREHRLLAEAWRAEATRRDPADPMFWRRLGLHLLLSQSYDEAERAYREALHWNPWSGDAMVGLSTSLIAQGRADEAMPLLRLAADLDPEDRAPEELLRLARRQLRAGTGMPGVPPTALPEEETPDR